MVSDTPLAVGSIGFPVISRDVPGEFVAYSYGAGATAEPSEVGLQTAKFLVDQANTQSLFARSGDAKICSGDSGTPATTQLSDGQLAVHGILTASERDVEGGNCTMPGGLLHWATGTNLVQFVVGSLAGCTVSGATTSCAKSTRLLPPQRRSATVPLGERRSIAEAAAVFGDALIELSHVPPEQATAPRLAGVTPVGIVTSEGHGTAWVRTDSSPQNLLSSGYAMADPYVKPPGGDVGRVLVQRWGISDNIDSRVEYLVPQVGKVVYKGTGTGTLIGTRLVRTVAHTMGGDYSGWPRFTLRYHGGPTTWSFNGGATWVTFQEKTAYTYYYGGLWRSLDCDNTFWTGTYAHAMDCLSQDWMILVMPENVWADVKVVPSYMGYTTAYLRTDSRNTGYPSCGDVTSSLISNCVTGRMYGQAGCSIDVVEAGGGRMWHSCDSTPGHSGGPIFFNSSGYSYIQGHDSSRDASRCPNTACPGAGTGTDTWLYNLQTTLRSTWSSYTL